MGLSKILSTIWKAFGQYFYLFYLNFLDFLFESKPLVRSGKNFVNNFLIVGDGYAYGFGDKAGFPRGIAKYMGELIRFTPRLRTKWKGLMMGKIGSTSSDWHPTTPLFDKLTSSASFKHSKHIILMVGSEDYLNATITPKDTLKNVQEIARALTEDYGKIVWVCTIVGFAYEMKLLAKDDGSGSVIPQHVLKWMELDKERNALILEWLESIEASAKSSSSSSSPQPIRIHKALDLNAETNYEYQNPRLYWVDARASSMGKLFFTSKGYAKVSKDLLEVVKNAFVKCEFEAFKDVLFSRGSAGNSSTVKKSQ